MVRLEWDFRALRMISNYFEKREASNDNRCLPPDDLALLDQMSNYLDGLVDKMQQSLRKIQRKGLLYKTINRAMWIARRSDLQELEREIRDWTQRFGVRVLGLPEEFRVAIRACEDGNDQAQPPAVVKSNDRLHDFLALTTTAKRKRSKAIMLEEPEELILAIERISDVSIHLMEHLGKQLILSSQKVSDLVRPGSTVRSLVYDSPEGAYLL